MNRPGCTTAQTQSKRRISMHALKQVFRSLLISLALVGGAGCVIGDEEGQEQTPEEEMISQVEEYADSGEVPYGVTCSMYGDCAYCEERRWRYGDSCVLVCYAWSCFGGGDTGGSCYYDCSRSS
jgi:hypothetical protein